MCGIFAYLGDKIDIKKIETAFMKTFKRGPDNNILKSICSKLIFGFHRLSINDTSFKGNQPLYHPNKPISVICNGEIYNHLEIIKNYDIKTYSNSDCEIILYLYEKYGIEETLSILDSESFAFIIYDGLNNTIIVARDRFGVRPLFVSKTSNNEYIFASEAKSIVDLVDENELIEQFKPGSFRVYNIFDNRLSDYTSYYNYNYPSIKGDFQVILQTIREKLTTAVKKRLMSDRPIGCLLSGGLDSSLISAIVAREFKNSGKGQLQTFSIGIKGSTDLKYAKMVADHIGSFHHTIEMEEHDFLDAIPEVIYNIESYDTTTVRASTGNYLVGKYIKENTDITVVFNGDGSDEQSGYLYLANAPTHDDFKDECVRLLKQISYFDVLRSDRSLSSNFSLETRAPFLDTDFVNYYMSIPTNLKIYKEGIEKNLLRMAFDDGLLPHDVLWRRKEAFSDGCSSNERSWHKIIQEYVDEQIPDEEYVTRRHKYTFNKPELKESYYYRKIFEMHYKGHSNIIPHFWLPKWNGEQNDPSARELSNYNV
jgi:asparagine synthase (glutamine-hydrolysing)